MENRSILSVSASFCGALYLIGFAAMGIISFSNSQLSHIELISLNPVSLSIWYAALYLVFPLSLLALSVSLINNQAQKSMSGGFFHGLTLIWSALMTISGLLALAAIRQVVAGTDPQQIQILFSLQDSLGGAIELHGGLWTILATWLARQQFPINRGIQLLGYLTGIVGIGTLIPGSEMAQAVFGIGQLCWFFAMSFAVTRAQQQPGKHHPADVL